MRIFPFDGKVSEIPQKMYTKWLDYDKIKFGFSIRTRRNQDYFVMDAVGHRKKLSDYFINQKIPAEERDATLLIADGSQILWIVGGRMGAGRTVGWHKPDGSGTYLRRRNKRWIIVRSITYRFI